MGTVGKVPGGFGGEGVLLVVMRTKVLHYCVPPLPATCTHKFLEKRVPRDRGHTGRSPHNCARSTCVGSVPAIPYPPETRKGGRIHCGSWFQEMWPIVAGMVWHWGSVHESGTLWPVCIMADRRLRSQVRSRLA